MELLARCCRVAIAKGAVELFFCGLAGNLEWHVESSDLLIIVVDNAEPQKVAPWFQFQIEMSRKTGLEYFLVSFGTHCRSYRITRYS